MTLPYGSLKLKAESLKQYSQKPQASSLKPAIGDSLHILRRLAQRANLGRNCLLPAINREPY